MIYNNGRTAKFFTIMFAISYSSTIYSFIFILLLIYDVFIFILLAGDVEHNL